MAEAMAASTELSVREVAAKALKTLSDGETRRLVICLGVENYQLQNIDAGFSAGDRSVQYIQAWLDKDTEASWEKIVSGLNEIGMNRLARKISTQRCPQSPDAATPSSDPSQPASVLTTQPVTTPASVTPAMPSSVATTSADDSEQSPNTAASDPSQPVTVNMRSVANVKATICRLEKTFSGLISRTRSSLCEKESQDKEFLDEFRDSLLVLPVAKKAVHVKFFRDSEDDIFDAGNIRKLFAILSRHLSYRNPEILQEIINMFCKDLQESMKEYSVVLEEFEKATTVDVYLTAVPDEIEEDVERILEMVRKIDKPASECTLYELRKLNQAIIKGSSLRFHSVYIGGVADN